MSKLYKIRALFGPMWTWLNFTRYIVLRFGT